jgi:hypothetical protein
MISLYMSIMVVITHGVRPSNVVYHLLCLTSAVYDTTHKENSTRSFLRILCLSGFIYFMVLACLKTP